MSQQENFSLKDLLLSLFQFHTPVNFRKEAEKKFLSLAQINISLALRGMRASHWRIKSHGTRMGCGLERARNTSTLVFHFEFLFIHDNQTQFIPKSV